MALQQTKEEKIYKTKRTLHKEDLAKELNVSVAKINEYILGDDIMPDNMNIFSKTNGFVEIETEERKKVAKYEGVFYNELKGGKDRTFYVVYKDLKTNKKIDLKIGRESQGYTETYCENIRKEILRDMRLGNPQTKVMNKRVFKEIITLNLVAEKYHKERALYMTEPNLKKSKSMYRRRIEPYIGDKNILEITVDDIQDIMLDLQEELANRSINIVVEKISTIFNHGINKGIFVGKNPVKLIEKLPDSNERLRYLTKQEINNLINSVQTDDILYIFTIIALTTGGRLASICDIKVRDIVFDDLIINISDDKGKSYYKSFLKNDKNFIAKLKQHIQDMDSSTLIFGNDTEVGHIRHIQRELSNIFAKLFNKRIIEEEVKEKNKNMPDKNKLAELRRNKVVVHTLRHTFASQLAIAGTPIYTIQKLMNHSDIKMTERYAKLSKDSGRDYVDGIL